MNKIYRTTMSNFLNDYPHIRLARPEDNEQLLIFVKKIKMVTHQTILTHKREPDFFAFSRLSGNQSLIFIMENQDKSIGGYGMLSKKKVYIEGELKTVGYLTDIRISDSLHRQTRFEWRSLYHEMLKNKHLIEEIADCSCFYSIIMGDNQQSLNAFTKGKRGVIYRNFCNFKSVNILFRYNIFKKINDLEVRENYIVNAASEDDLPEIRNFLHSENKNKTFGYNFCADGEDELMKRFRNWDQFSISSFILVRDKSNKIVACTAPQMFSSHKSLIIEKLNFKFRLLGLVAGMLGLPKLVKGEELKICFLTHLEISSHLSFLIRKKIFLLIIEYWFRHKPSKAHHMLSFYDYHYNDFSSMLKEFGYFYLVNDGSIYEVSPIEDSWKPVIFSDRITHEMALS